jgi:hypothetical protein
MALESKDIKIRHYEKVLSTTADWTAWYYIRKNAAINRGIWDYVDPDLVNIPENTLTPPEEPTEPSSGASAAAIEDYRFQYHRYEAKLVRHEKKEKLVN